MRLNPRRVAEIHALVDRGELPPVLDLPCRERARLSPSGDWHVTVRVRAGIPPVPGSTDRILHHARVVKTLVDAGLIAPIRRTASRSPAARCVRWGTTSAGAIAVAAARAPHQPAVIDELGTLTYGELNRRANALASALAAHGIRPGDGVAIMCRNHRGFIDATVAVLAARRPRALPQHDVRGARSSPTSSPARARGDRLRRGVRRAASTTPEAIGMRFVAWHDGEGAAADPLLEDLIADGDSAGVPAPDEPRPRRDPHLRHDGHAEGRAPQQRRPQLDPRPRCCRRSRCARARRR